MRTIESYKIEECPYRLLYVDLTKRCNMKCTNCYNRSGPDVIGTDITIEFFENVCRRLPAKSEIRLCGGEPTIHPELFKFLDITRKYNHLPTVVSNGLMYLDDGFMEKVSKYKTTNWCIALNGGLSDKELYEFMDGDEKYYELKMKALQKLLDYKISRIYINFIIIRNRTERSLKELINFVLNNKIRGVKLRSIGMNLGRLGKGHVEPYTGKEFKKLIHNDYIPENEVKLIRSGLEPNCKECCYRFYYKNIYFSFAEFASKNSCDCWLRGKILDDFTVEPFFSNMVAEDLKAKEAIDA